MNARLSLAVALVPMLAAGCESPPTLGKKVEYSPPRWERQPNLAKKAEVHEASTLAIPK